MKTKFKKLLTILLFAVLTVSSTFAFGCNSSASKFKGNFEEISSQQIQTYSNQIASSASGGVLSVEDGFLVELKLTSGNQTINATYKTGKVNGVYNLSVDLKVTYNKKTAKMSLYYDGIYAYAEIPTGKDPIKIKERIDLAEFMDEFMEVAEIDFQEIYNELVENCQNELVLLREETEDEIKIKLELLKGTILDEVKYSNYENVFLFDKAFNFKGVMLKSTGTIYGIKQNTSLIITEYTGELKKPNVNDYIEMEIPEI